MLRGTIVAIVVALVATSAASAVTPKPKPWQWTTSQTAAKVSAALADTSQIYRTTGNYGPVTCKGIGKQTARRYTTFVCSFMFDEHGPAGITVGKRAWAKIRAAGRGGACLSLVGLAQIKQACLAARGLVAAPANNPAAIELRRATAKRFGSPIPLWQSFTYEECFGVDGYYECEFESVQVTGKATVVYRLSGPVTTFTSLTCGGDYVGRPECSV